MESVSNVVINESFLVKVPMLKKKVPAGMSKYQAEWLVDDEEFDDDGEEDDDMDDEDEEESDGEGNLERDMAPFDENDGMDAQSVGSAMNETISIAGIEDRPADIDEVNRFRQEQDDIKWPDQVDTPIDQQARVRFQKFRGLKSFR